MTTLDLNQSQNQLSFRSMQALSKQSQATIDTEVFIPAQSEKDKEVQRDFHSFMTVPNMEKGRMIPKITKTS